MPAINIPSLNVNAIGEGLKDSKNYEMILDTLQRYRKELNFYLMNLDLDNMPSVANYMEDLNGNFSSLTQTVDGFEIKVGNYEGQISQFLQTVEGFQTQVLEYGDEVNGYATKLSEFTQTVDGFQTTVLNYEGQVSQFLQTVDGFQTTVADYEGQVSTLTQTAEAVELRFENMKTLNGVDGVISGGVTTINASGITVGTLDNKSKLEMLASDGFSLWTNTGSGLEKRFYVDSTGKIQAKGLVIDGNSVFNGTIKANQLLIGGTNGSISFNDLDNQPFIPTKASDIGAKPASYVPTWTEITSKPTILSANDIRTTVITKDWIGTLGLMVGDQIQMGTNARISWSQVTSQPTILTNTDVTTITNNTLSTTTVLAKYLKVKMANIDGTLSADKIVGGTITGVTIDVSTNATIGRKLNLGTSSDSSEKGIYFTNDSYISSTSRKVNIYSSQGIDIYANNAALNIGTRGSSGQPVNISGANVNIDTSTWFSGKDINLAVGYSGSINFKAYGTTRMTIDRTGISGTIIATTIKNYNDSYNNISFRTYNGFLEWRNGTGTWNRIG